MTPLDRHSKVVLNFSGGKDSIACLLMLREHLDKIIVLWMNTGAAFPETIEQMQKVRAMCPNFLEVRGRQPEHIALRGYPVDVLPVRSHPDVQYLAQQKRPPLQGFMECCFESLMRPMYEATVATGASLIIRGQKLADHHKSSITSGDVVNGIEYWFPVEGWTDEQVLDYVRDSGLLPAHYSHANTSLDCWSCTAYLSENQWKLPYLKQHHPEKAAEVERRLRIIRQEIKRDMAFLEE